MTESTELLAVEITLTIRDRQRRQRFPFRVPASTAELAVRFNYGPDAPGPHHNLVTVALADPNGLRGSAHRWRCDQLIRLSGAETTPGFARGPLYEGEWECLVDAHEILNAERAGCVVGVTIEALVDPSRPVSTATDERRTRPGPAHINSVPGWYSGDLHSHTVHGDGADTVAAMANTAHAAGLDFLAITEHNTTTPMAELADAPDGLLVIRGTELTTFFGHANLLGTARWFDWHPDDGLGLSRVFKTAQHDGGLVVANHPRAVGNPHCTGCQWGMPTVDVGALDCIEVWNGPWANWESRNDEALALWSSLLDRGHRLSCVAGTDAHRASWSTGGLGLTRVMAAGLNESAIIDALRQGRAYLSAGPELRHYVGGADGWSESYPGDIAGDSFGAPLRIDVTRLGEHATLHLVVDGTVVESWPVSPPGSDVTTTMPESRVWHRWEVRRGSDPYDEMILVTNPWYRSYGRVSRS